MADFEFRESRGDTIQLLVPVTRNGSPVDITDAQFYFTAKRSKTDADVNAIIQKSSGDGISILDASGGMAVIVIQPEDTDFLDDEPRLYCDVQMVEADGTTTTIARGRLTLLYDITRS